MWDPNGDGAHAVDVADLNRLVAELETIVAEKERLADGHRSALEETMHELTRYRRALNALRPPEKTVRAVRRGRGIRGEEELQIMLQRIRAIETPVDPETPGSFTSKHLERQLGVTGNVADRLINALRDRGEIRMVGQFREGNANRLSRLFVAV